MATVSTAQLAAKIDSLATAFQALALQATTDNPPPRKVQVVDVGNRQQVIEPGRIFYMAEIKWQVPLIPSSYIPATICLFNAQNDGKLVQAVLPGTPAAVATQLGIECDKVLLAAPVVVTEAATVAAANAAIAASEGTTVTVGDDVWTLGPGGETLKNGQTFAGGQGSKYAVVDGAAYTLGGDGLWWKAADGGWLPVGAVLPNGA